MRLPGSAKVPLLVGADAPAGAGEDALLVMRVDSPKSTGNGSYGEHGGDGLPEIRGKRPPRRVGEHSPVFAGEYAAESRADAAQRLADATGPEPLPPPGEPDERQPLLRWCRERPIPVRGGDQRSVFSRWAEERQSLRQPDAGELENPSEMERQVRDQLYGPGFRRR